MATQAELKAARATEQHNQAHARKVSERAKSATSQVALKRNVSNSAEHDKAVALAKQEVAAGFDLMVRGDRAIGLGQQRIAHALLTLDKEEAFPRRVHLARWFTYSPEQVRDLSAMVKLFIVGDAPEKPAKGEHSVEYANQFAAYRAKNAAIVRSLPLAAAFAILMAKRGTQPTFDEKKGWNVPVSALCEKGQSARKETDMAFLDNTARVVTVERLNQQGKMTESIMSIRCSVDQVVRAVKSHNVKAKTPDTGDGKGANETNTARDKANTFGPFSVAVIAADPAPLLTVWHSLTRIYREGSLATLDTKTVATLQRLNVEIAAFLSDRTKAIKAVSEMPTTNAGRAMVKAGEAAKAQEAKAS